MRVSLARINDKVHLQACNEEGNTFELDGSEKIGGEGKGFRPMQTVLAALGSCSSMDVLSILRKQRQEVEDYHVYVDGERDIESEPSLFNTIHVTFELKGRLDEAKVARAVELSMTRYCSVAKILEPTAKITYSYKITA